MTRPRRSVLYVPGANRRALEKARSLSADALILDLEDSVPPESKRSARESVCAAVVRGFGNQPQVVVRVNARGTEWYLDDLQAAVAARANALAIPKIISADEVRFVADDLQRFGAAPDMQLWVMIEMPAAVLQAPAIAAATSRLTVLVMGTNDLTQELQAESVPGRLPLLYALSSCVAAARAAGLQILDGVFNGLQDADGFKEECRQARQLGFDGKTLIHPSQIEPCHRMFAPSAAEIDRARRVIEAYEAARRTGQGVTTVDGQLVEGLHAAVARRVLRLAGEPAG